MLLGNETVKLLKDLVDSLRAFFTDLTTATTVSGEPIPKFLETVPSINRKLTRIEGRLESLKSKKVWVE